MDLTDPEPIMSFDSSSDFLEKKNLQEIQKFDGVIFVVRAFNDESIPHPYGEVNFLNLIVADLAAFSLELSTKTLRIVFISFP